MTTPDKRAESPLIWVYCDLTDCGRRITVRAHAIDSLTLTEDAETGEVTATARVDMLPLRLYGKTLCDLAECGMGTASLTTTQLESIATLRESATRAVIDFGYTDAGDAAAPA